MKRDGSGYRPQTKFGEGNVFTSVCQEFCPQLVAATETLTVGKRAARILVECFLVLCMYEPHHRI